MRLETERLILRPLREDDLDGLVSVLDNMNIARNTARIPFPYTRADAEAFLGIAGKPCPGTLRLSITRKGVDRVMGGIGYEVGIGGAHAELGYWLAESDWGRGFGSEAAHAVTAHAFDVAGHGWLTAGYRIGNEDSRRILERLGFEARAIESMFSKGVGAEVPVMRMELTREAWTKKAKTERRA